jgi:hypothetical protein
MPNKRVSTDLAALLIHTVFASLSVVIGAGVGLTLLVVATHVASDVPSLRRLAEIVCVFVFFAIPVLSGFLINQRARNRSACFIWAMGLLFLFAWAIEGISGLKRSPYFQQLTGGQYLSYECYRLFGFERAKWRRGGDGQGLEELIVFVPVLGSIAYSFGSWFALRCRPETESAKRITSAQT